MHTWHFYDGGFNDNEDNSSDDNHDRDDDQHVEPPVGRVQVFLRTEFGQLVVQMFVGLLYRVLTMFSKYDDHQQHCFSNGYCDDHSNLRDSSRSHNSDNNGYKHFHDSVAAGLQVLVCRQCKTLDKKVQLGEVRWLPRMWATRKTACCQHTASEQCHFCIGSSFFSPTVAYRNTHVPQQSAFRYGPSWSNFLMLLWAGHQLLLEALSPCTRCHEQQDS